VQALVRTSRPPIAAAVAVACAVAPRPVRLARSVPVRLEPALAGGLAWTTRRTLAPALTAPRVRRPLAAPLRGSIAGGGWPWRSPSIGVARALPVERARVRGTAVEPRASLPVGPRAALPIGRLAALPIVRPGSRPARRARRAAIRPLPFPPRSERTIVGGAALTGGAPPEARSGSAGSRSSRPGAGTASRPGAGTASRPGAGTAGRAGAGTTARPGAASSLEARIVGRTIAVARRLTLAASRP
jgi:hypothetical protein